MSLAGDLVTLRTIEREDVEVLAAWDLAYATWPELNDKPYLPKTVADVLKEYDDGSETGYRAGDAFAPFAVDAEGELVGAVCLWGVDLHNRRAHLGIVIGEDFRGHGYGTDACRAILRYAFVDRGLHRVQLEVLDTNTGALRAYEKAGFRRDGLLREAAWIRGGFQDEVVMSVLTSDPSAP
ncbi:MAG: family N-acetyltransferase [Marmoricola sp.]|nr:family N-acetyltransferase [Marmoricola sp.]